MDENSFFLWPSIKHPTRKRLHDCRTARRERPLLLNAAHEPDKRQLPVEHSTTLYLQSSHPRVTPGRARVTAAPSVPTFARSPRAAPTVAVPHVRPHKPRERDVPRHGGWAAVCDQERLLARDQARQGVVSSVGMRDRGTSAQAWAFQLGRRCWRRHPAAVYEKSAQDGQRHQAVCYAYAWWVSRPTFPLSRRMSDTIPCSGSHSGTSRSPVHHQRWRGLRPSGRSRPTTRQPIHRCESSPASLTRLSHVVLVVASHRDIRALWTPFVHSRKPPPVVLGPLAAVRRARVAL